MILSKRAKGYSMCFIGIMLLTPDTLFIRLLQHLPNVTVLFFRSIIPATTTMILMLCIDASLFVPTFKGIGFVGIIAGMLFGATNMLFTFAVQHTAVANVVVINASSSIFSSISAYFIYGETIPLRTSLVILVCLGAIALVFSTAFQGDGSSLLGDLLSIGSAVSVGGYLTLCRYKSIKCGSSNDNVITKVEEILDVLSYNAIGFLLASIACLCLGVDFQLVSGYDIGLLILDGVFVLALSFFLLTIGPLYIIAAEVSLFFLIETILGPVWVYAAGYEAPPQFTVYGGICIILALACNSILALREEVPRTDDSDPIPPSNEIELSPYQIITSIDM